MPCFSVFADQTNLKTNWKFSLSQYRRHESLIDVENCVKNALNLNLRKQDFTVTTNGGGGDYQFEERACQKHIWVAVITNWGLLHWSGLEEREKQIRRKKKK